MWMTAIKQIKTAILLLISFSILTGLIYPFIMTGIAQLLWPWQANGSLIERNGQYVGSALIGQSFTAPNYFWGRPSATTPFPYNAANSSGSNLGPSNPDFLTTIKTRATAIQAADPEHRPVPVELVTASGSGLDAEISPLAALYQIPRIAPLRGISPDDLKLLIQHHAKKRTFGILGEPRVNVLELNLALDKFSIDKEF